MSPHVPGITALCLQYITYDPNYNYEDDSDMECDDNGYDEG